MIINFQFNPRPPEQTMGFAIHTDETPRKGDVIRVAEDAYKVDRVEWSFGGYEAENYGDLTVTVVCALVT